MSFAGDHIVSRGCCFVGELFTDSPLVYKFMLLLSLTMIPHQ